MRAVVSVHAQFTTLSAVAQAKGCVDRIKKKNHVTNFAPAHFSCCHSTPLTLTSSSSIPSSRTTSQVKLPINKHCTPPNEESGPLAKTTSSTTCSDESVFFNGDKFLNHTASKVRGCRCSTQRRFLKCNCRMHQEEEDSEDFDNPESKQRETSCG